MSDIFNYKETIPGTEAYKYAPEEKKRPARDFSNLAVEDANIIAELAEIVDEKAKLLRILVTKQHSIFRNNFHPTTLKERIEEATRDLLKAVADLQASL